MVIAKKTPISDYGDPVSENVCISSRPLPALAFKTMNLFWLNHELKVSLWALEVILKKFEINPYLSQPSLTKSIFNL